MSTKRESALIEANLPLVGVILAKMRLLRDDDARQEGAIALIKAVRRFDPSKARGGEFRPFALACIRNAIIDLGRTRACWRHQDYIQAIPAGERGPTPQFAGQQKRIGQ